MADFRKLFEQFLSLIDKPYDYNHLLCQIFDDLLAQQQGQTIINSGGVPYLFDVTRDKNLSLARPMMQAGAYGAAITNRYLRMSDVASAGPQGFPIFRPATITAMAARSRSTGAWTAEVRRNGVAVTLASIAVSARMGYDAHIDVDVEPGDWLQVFASGVDIDHPIVAVELAWRLPNP